jgi:hypothetical protein
LSEIANRGCGCLRFKTVSCCRRARFSRSNSRRERRSRIARTGRGLSRQSMSQSRMETGNAKHAIHLIDLTADHYFGERRGSTHGQCGRSWRIGTPVEHRWLRAEELRFARAEAERRNQYIDIADSPWAIATTVDFHSRPISSVFRRLRYEIIQHFIGMLFDEARKTRKFRDLSIS